MRIIIILFIILASIRCEAQKAGDSVKILPNRPLNGISTAYERLDNWHNTQDDYIPKMAGKTYKITKMKRGYIHVKDWTKSMNDWTPMHFKLDIEQMRADSAIIIIPH